MGLAQAVFGWTASQFWRSTPHEFFAAVEAHQEVNAPRKEDGDT